MSLKTFYCENFIYKRLQEMWFRLRTIDEPANILVRMSSWISRQSYGPIKKFRFDLDMSEFFHWSKANMDWTIDIYGDNPNRQV